MYPTVSDPKFRPEEVAEIPGVDRTAVKRLTDRRMMGYYQLGSRTRRIGLQHLERYFSVIKGRAKQKAEERKDAKIESQRQAV